MAIRTTAQTKRRKTGDTATIARKRYYRSAERYLKQAEQASGATAERMRYLAERDLKAALNTYSKHTTQPFSKPIQALASKLGVNLADERARIKGMSDKAAEKVRSAAIELGDSPSFKRLQSRKVSRQERREEEARAVFNSPIGKRILGGLVDIWRDVAIDESEDGETMRTLDRSKILPALYAHFKVDNMADLLTEVEAIAGQVLYAAGEDEIYDIVKLTLQTHIAQDNSVIR